MRGHEEASGTKYYPEGLQEKWKPKDPVDNFEEFIIKEGVMTELEVENLKDELKREITISFDTALKYEPVLVSKERELEDLYAPFEQHVAKAADATKELRFVDAIAEAVDLAMEKHPSLTLMGQDIADYGGVFKVTDGLMAKYGKERVRNTPLCESAILGAALGLSIKGKKAMMEMQFADFASTGFNQIVNNLAKIHWRWGQNADVVIRMPTGAGVGAGPFHSQSNEAWFFKTPGLKIVYPSSPEDAKGLLLAAFEDPNPVMFFEHKFLYRSLNGQVPEGYYTTEIGKAKIAKLGTDVTIITYGLGVHWAMDLAAKNPEHSIEVLDLRTLVPLDFESVYASVNKTGKVLVLHEDTLTGGIGAEISARITEQCFEHLDAPVRRCASLDTPVPFAAGLEKQFLATNELETIFHELMEY